ncbi:NAD-dependent protein deacetylase hst4 like [Verticillium longisporum]|uniref:NAD-dependent protein deacetylase hst4 like n=1 Tax=Verticillium longisporum TaxID=100787 RepID=A0A8I2ZQC2_VERLO|nr:NAD-dependent protein deacetylase hst4 like [Verticillium longisporum]
MNSLPDGEQPRPRDDDQMDCDNESLHCDRSRKPDFDAVPSSPLSELAKTPPLFSSPLAVRDPADRYPSPSMTSLSSSSALASGCQSPSRADMPLASPLASDTINVSSFAEMATSAPSERPRKRRKIAAPKERTTEYLDFDKVRDNGFDAESDRKLDRLVDTLRYQKKIVVIAGAGISVSAGIPDFRSKQGLFATLPNEHKMKGSGKHLFDASVYKHDETTEKFHKMVCDLATMVKSAKPTKFHHLLASLAAEGRLMRLYTQNVDCVDTNMPPLKTTVPLNRKGPWPKTIQLHGSVEHMNCSKCGQITRSFSSGTRLHFAQSVPRWTRMVLYNEYNPDEEAIGNVSSSDLKGRPDAVIVVGTSLKIPGVRRLVKELCQATRNKRGGFTAWINLDSEPQHNDFKDCWDLVVRGKSDDVAHFAQLPPYDVPSADPSDILNEEDNKVREQWLQRDKVEVQLSQSSHNTSLPKPEFEALTETQANATKVQGIPTPSTSPRLLPTLPGKKAGKSRQSKLAFGATPVASSDSEAPSKKRKRAPAKKSGKQAKKAAEPPKNAVPQTFRAVKNRALVAPVQAKQEKDVKQEVTNELPTLRPQQPSSRSPVAYTAQKSFGKNEADSLMSSPLLPALKDMPCDLATLPTTPAHTQRGTSPLDGRSSPCIGISTDSCLGSIVAAASEGPRIISPSSKPRGMEGLIN